ncbi:MAG TPA: LCP family protein [Mycobacteriales bacterium]|nr:LCP family protein [Mycobacteriales bacterium]
MSRGRRRKSTYQEPQYRRPPGFAAPTAPEVVIQPRMTRREERKVRKRQQRRKMGLAGGLGAGVIAVIVVITVIVGVHQVVTHHGSGERTQVTVLLQLQGSGGQASGSVLLAADPASKEGLEVLIPGRLITDVCGYGSQNFGDVLALPNGASASRSALSGILGGVVIDGSWILSDDELSRMVDAVGGVSVDVDTNVIQATAGGGARVLVAAGAGQRLAGTQAVEYATYQKAREGAAAQLARLQSVVDATVQALPRSTTGVEALIRRLGPGAQSTIGVGNLAQLLVNLAKYDRTEAGVFPTDLPVTPIDAGGASPSYRPDTSASGVTQLVNTRLANSLPKNANNQHASVLLLNGLGTPGLVSSACPRLASAGFTYAGSQNAPSFSSARSQVDIFHDYDVDQGYALARALGLPSSDVRRSVVNQNVAKFVVILGRDYHP